MESTRAPLKGWKKREPLAEGVGEVAGLTREGGEVLQGPATSLRSTLVCVDCHIAAGEHLGVPGGVNRRHQAAQGA